MRNFQKLGEIQETLRQITEACMLKAALLNLRERYELQNIAYLALALPKLTRQEPHIEVTYDDDWVAHYTHHDYVKVDPVLHHSVRSILPTDWSNFSRKDKRVDSLFNESVQFGVGNQGLTIPVRGGNGELALFSVTAEELDDSWQKRIHEYVSDYQMIAFYFHEAVLAANGIKFDSVHLAPRELEVLKWVANGKTANDVATILNISEHTVRYYLENARYRLGALNQTHAVARAIAKVSHGFST